MIPSFIGTRMRSKAVVAGSTSTGETWEAFSLDSLTGAFDDWDRFGVAGNHDHGTFVRGYLDRMAVERKEFDAFDQREIKPHPFPFGIAAALAARPLQSKQTAFVERGFALCPPEGGTPSGPS